MYKYYAKPLDKVHIKTLEEIRQEKALRQKQATKTQNEETVTQHQVPINHKRVVLNSKPRVTSETKPDNAPTEQNSSYSQVRVRTSAQDCFKLSAVPPVSVHHTFLPEKKQERVTPAVQNVMKDESYIKVYHAANPEVQEARASKRTEGSTVYTQKKMKGDPKVNMEAGEVNNLKEKEVNPIVQNVMKAESDMKVYHAANLEVQEARASKITGGSTVYTKKNSMNGDPKGNTEPGAVNNSTPTKSAFKRKSQETLAVADMRPLVTAVSSTVNVQISNDVSSVLAPKRLKESVGPPAPELVSPTSTEAIVQCHTISTTAEPVLLKEDDLDTLINEFLEGIPEEELQVDPNKTTDDLIRELYEFMDSLP